VITVITERILDNEDNMFKFCLFHNFALFLLRRTGFVKLLMRPKFQKHSTLKFDGRIIPAAKRSRINETQISKASRIEICKLNYPAGVAKGDPSVEKPGVFMVSSCQRLPLML